MERFLLLRDNQEMGPFSLEELMKQGIRSKDLIWIEGKSIAWDYPFNIEALKGIAGLFSSVNPPVDEQLVDITGTPIPAVESVLVPENINPGKSPNTAESFHKSYTEEAEQQHQSIHSPVKKIEKVRKPAGESFFLNYGVWIIAIVALLAGTTWITKKAFDIFTGKGVSQNKMIPASTPLKTLPDGFSPQKDEDATIQNAISREIVPVDTSHVKEPIKKKPRLKELKKYLRVESNDYKVGVFGGINNLQLTVFNNSSYVLDKVVLQVDYLKPKGESLQTEKYTYFSIPPHGKKTLDIPPSKRGVKVKYKILDAKSREYKVALVQA